MRSEKFTAYKYCTSAIVQGSFVSFVLEHKCLITVNCLIILYCVANFVFKKELYSNILLLGTNIVTLSKNIHRMSKNNLLEIKMSFLSAFVVKIEIFFVIKICISTFSPSFLIII